VYDRSRPPCSCRPRCVPTTPRLPRRDPPGLPTLIRVATLDLSVTAAANDDDDDGPETTSTVALRVGDAAELALCRADAAAAAAGSVSRIAGSLNRLTGDGRPLTGGIRRTTSSLPSPICLISPSPADDRVEDDTAIGASPASLRDRLVGTRRPLSLAIELSQLSENTGRLLLKHR